MKKLFVILLFFGSFIVNAQDPLKEFEKLLHDYDIAFTMPEGYKIKNVIPNPDLSYSFAMTSLDGSIEVRYSIFPLKDMIKEYRQYLSAPKENEILLDPNKIHITNPLTILLNLSKGKSSPQIDFPPEAVKKEFNADFGTISTFKFNSEYGKGYSVGQLIYLHKTDIADIAVVYLSNATTSDEFFNKATESFHSIRFK